MEELLIVFTAGPHYGNLQRYASQCFATERYGALEMGYFKGFGPAYQD